MKNSRGFSLIEVLVTIVLTTVGILGMVALQSRSIQYTQDSVNRNTAIALTNELVEIMRANRDELFVKRPPIEPMYSQLAETSALYKADGSFDFGVADCATPAQTAKQQAGCWLVKARATLPSASDAAIAGQFMVCPSFKMDSDGKPECAGSSYTGSTMAVQLAWRSKESVCGKDSDSDICTFSTRVEL
ncbi:type IV pilus modification protein PilV [Pseudomonas sp. C27(2019)]|uniref:type IV pilus modification protein PilV n=1 Tax=Pseudomonas sp. C27(2019) TaxID=2604941 RepID=UPI0012486C45|nr:type IV pilus modification protein PilV [Pseudomonas sp. C27(2019)]QEY59453.1 type IV pilus modification protein PilV [Pseudomonas sp. C27(2019)]